ncbi:glycosyltransferase family 39 protein [Kitasatospora terrestris]|uniref:Glycosyltransferase RgtA/B/C/D-like domain-containing protein n=1 Tax=Kitasatospora terrestris TaxID=258051 RepID=A0ABP9DQ30_9ACTN
MPPTLSSAPDASERRPEQPRHRRGLDALHRVPRPVRSVWLWPVLATLVVGLYHVTVPVMWHDELATLSVVRRPAGDIVDMIRHVDAVHGTYYLFLHFWISVFGESPLAMRLPSVLAMAGAAGCTALAGRRMFDARAGLVAGLVFAMLPTVARYGQEARSYGFVVFAAAAALVLLLRALERPTALRWLAYAAALCCSGYLHLVSLVYLAPHAVGVALAWWRDRRNWRLPAGFVGAVLAAVAAAYPLVHLSGKQAARQIGWIGRPVFGDLWNIWPQILGGTSVTVAVLTVAVLAVGSKRPGSVLLGWCLVLIPVGALWVASTHGSVSYFMPKYMFFVLPGVSVLAGAGLALVRLRATLAGLAVIGLLALPDQRVLHGTLSHAKYVYPVPVTWFDPLDYRAAARLVAAGYHPGDAAAFGQNQWQLWWGVDIGVRYYLPEDVVLRDVFAGQSGQQRDDLWPTMTPDPKAALGTTPPPRIWLVAKDGGQDPFGTLPPAYAKALQERYKLDHVKTVSGMSVSLLVRR